MAKKTPFSCITLLLVFTQSMATSYWLVGIDDGNQCHAHKGRLIDGDQSACICIKKAPAHSRWQLKQDLTGCLPSSHSNITQSQCLHAIYMNHGYPSFSDHEYLANHLLRCRSDGDTKHCD